MITRRTILGAATVLSALAITGNALAEDKGKGKGKGKAKKKNHRSGSAALGKDKLKKNGKYKIAKDGKLDVSADVSGGKVVSVTATHAEKGGLAARKVKSRKKLGQLAPGVTLAGGLQLAQSDDYWYYGWWFEDDEEDYYYWFEADYVDTSDSWEDYYDYS